MSLGELEDFMNPNLSNVTSKHGGGGVNKSKEELTFLSKLDRAIEIPETLNQDLEQICTYCVKLIGELNPDVKFN